MTELDLRLFHWLNGVAIHPWLDWLMPIVTRRTTWGVFLGAGALYLLMTRGIRGRQVVLSLVLALALGDFGAAQILKPAFHRLRPCHAPVAARVLGSCGGRHGFPSNHATNAASATAVLGIYYPATLAVTIPCAMLVGWSRIYLGVHYPGDVAAGFLLGGCLGSLVASAVGGKFVRRLPDN